MKMFHAAAYAAALCMVPVFASAKPENYKIDPVHSSVIFSINHMGVSNTHGRFNKLEGKMVYDADDASKSSIEVKIDADSLDTNNAMRDTHVKSEEYLDTKKFPTLEFKSKSVKKLSDKEFELTGDLTLHGVTKPLTTKLTKVGEAKDPKGNYRIGGETTFVIKRSEFGITAMPGALGEEIPVTIAIEGIREEAK